MFQPAAAFATHDQEGIRVIRQPLPETAVCAHHLLQIPRGPRAIPIGSVADRNHLMPAAVDNKAGDIGCSNQMSMWLRHTLMYENAVESRPEGWSQGRCLLSVVSLDIRLIWMPNGTLNCDHRREVGSTRVSFWT